MARKVQAVEATAKRWKMAQATGVLGMLVGAVWIFGAMAVGASVPIFAGVVVAVGIPVWVVGRLGAWWFHG